MPDSPTLNEFPTAKMRWVVRWPVSVLQQSWRVFDIATAEKPRDEWRDVPTETET